MKPAARVLVGLTVLASLASACHRRVRPVTPGMSTEDVLKSWGRPCDVLMTTTSSGLQSSVWTYCDGCRGRWRNGQFIRPKVDVRTQHCLNRKSAKFGPEGIVLEVEQ